MKYFKEFPDIETYKKFAKSTALISPNVSTIANQGNEPAKFDDDAAFLYVTINVTNVSPASQILCTNYNDVIDYIEIDDGTILNNLVLGNIFYDGFTTIGNHKIKIRFKDKYKIGGSDSEHTGVFGVPSVVDVLIPNVYTEIKSGCFKNAENLSKINIPPSIKVLETAAIAGSGITSAKIPSTVENIGQNLFSNCNKLETVDISEANFKNISDYTLGYGAFENCTSLKSLTVPKSIKKIQNNAIYNCTNLESITFEEESHCELIGYGGIRNCPKLTEITLPEGLTTLTSTAIYNCENLEKIILPSTIKTIGYNAIGNCNFKELTLPNGLETFKYGAISGPFELEELVIPNSVTDMYSCFSGNSNTNKIKKLVLPINENTTALSNFFTSGPISSSIDASYLEEIELPSNLTILNSGQLANLSNLKSITLPSSLTTLKQNCLGSCTGLTSITIPSSVTEISQAAFSGCTNLEEVIFENNSQLNILSTSAFDGCSKLSSINIPSTVSDISHSPFSGCTSLGYVENGIRYYDLPNNLGTTITNIEDKTLTSYTIKSGVTDLINVSKYEMPNATSITLSEGITSLTLSNSSFKYWDTLETVNLPSSIETIEDDTFNGCTSLSQNSINSIYSINEYALGFEYYLNHTNKDFSKEYLSMKFNGSASLKISSLSSNYENISLLEYSSDNGETWNNIKPTTSTGSSVISVDKDHTYMFKGITNRFILDSNNYYESVFSTSNVTSLDSISPKVYVFGNIMSLLKGDKFENTTLGSSSDYSAAFKGLFGTNSTVNSRRVLNVVDASKLILPNSTSSNCYTDMFNQCKFLKSAPQLPSNECSTYCYYRMFKQCTSLIDTPKIPQASMGTHCYEEMFYGCTSLQTITCLSTINSNFTWYTKNWVYGVPSGGTFYKNSQMTKWESNNNNGIPSGWTVQDYVSNN